MPPSKTATALNPLADNPVVETYLAQIDSDVEAAIDLADMVLKSDAGKLYSPATRAELKGDRDRLDKCWENFNSAWNAVLSGKAKDNKALVKAYSKYVIALEILEQSNVKHEAVMTSGLAIMAAALHQVVLTVIANKKKRLGELKKELEDLLKLLQKAEREVTEAKAQLALNAAITAVTFCLGPVGWGARIGVAVGSMAVHTIIDASLGPSSGSIEGSVNTVAGESVELVDKLSKGSKRLGGAASAVITMGMDVGEIGDAYAIVAKIKKQLPKTQSKYDALVRESRKWASDIRKCTTNFDAAAKAYRSSARKAAKSSRTRQALMKEFKKKWN